ncbi:MAG: hydroxymethylbilane synthase [Halobacteriota archaeon]
MGTRGSKLALVQAKAVKSVLAKSGVESKLVIVQTSGDNFADKPFREAGIGAFVRDIDNLMLNGDIDIAVHSMKDVPTKRPKEISICAVMPRASPYDVLIFEQSLPKGATIGTSSLRRRAQLARYCPRYNLKQIRGNIDTRIRKLKERDFDAVILAEAGLDRLGINIKKKRLPFIPSPNQGIIAVVANQESDDFEIVAKINDEQTFIEGMVERIIMEELGGGCLAPLGILAQREHECVKVVAEVLSLDGKRIVHLSDRIPIDSYERDAKEFAQQVKEDGAASLIAEAVASFSALPKNETKKLV